MPPLRRCLAGLALLLASLSPVRAAEWRVPPLAGELSGDFTPLNVPGAPKVHWQLVVQPAADAKRAIEIALDGPGLRLRATALLDAAGNGSWRVAEGEFDLGPWFPIFASALPRELSEISVAGKLRVSGEGTWENGQVAGRGVVALREGRVDAPALKLLLEGVALDLEFDDLAAWRSRGSPALAWQAGKYDVVALGPGRVEFGLVPNGVRVERANLRAFDGDVTVGAFAFEWANPVFEMNADVRGAEIAMFVPLLPPVVSEARGKLDGRLSLRRDASGIQIGAGQLGLRPGESAQLRLTPTPGLLSASLPDTVKKYYPGLGDLEEGRVPLKADRLDVRFTPAGDAEGRTAAVRVAGGPVDPRLRAPVDLEVNVRGPLDQLIKLGTDSRLHFR